MATIRPLGRNVLVELDPIELVTKGGIHIPETGAYYHKNRPDGRWATVVATGPRCRLGLQPGDRVLVNAWLTDSAKSGVYAGKDPGDKTALLSEDDVYLVGEKEQAAE